MATKRNGGVFTILSIIFFLATLGKSADLPCNAREVEGRSVVCVCNATYCDTITRELPNINSFVTYTSSSAGKRFEKWTGTIRSILDRTNEDADGEKFGPIDEESVTIENEEIESIDDENEEFDPKDEERDEDDVPLWRRVAFRVYTNVQTQVIEGFGGSVTDAAAINWRSLSDGAQRRFIDSYFSPRGIEYNMIRVPIGGSDFSTHPYAYNELPWNDAALTNFSLTEEDLFYKLPMIRLSQAAAAEAGNKVQITASTWSPPVWMKSNERITGFGQLKPEFYQTYADYHLRFIEAYARAHVNIWAITTTNEPLNGIVPIVNFNSLGWTPSELGRWVANNLGPTIRNSNFSNTLILAVDDQRYTLPIWLRGMEIAEPRSIDYIDGIAVHYYGNFVSPRVLARVQERYPNKILLATEACEGPMPWNREKVIIGSWRRARRYISSIIEDLNNFVVGWIDWNLCLNENGGPNWAENYVDSPIIVSPDKDEFIKQPMFYAMGHFSKFIPRESRRLYVERWSLRTIENVAVLTPEGNIVVVVHNRRRRERKVRIYVSRTRYAEFIVDPQSVTTIEINPRQEGTVGNLEDSIEKSSEESSEEITGGNSSENSGKILKKIS
ncbi:lysosomal acid glucosylceramidase-like [Achroia grisella]|uniref:lysosomal acid glucosylceramidase-like n=1 Tax=Achroia grisella TaxID=688607 RepID=UPI0027D2CC7D|nr:lysosomal acid glucosylceramidase-like [Achroia grisella]